MKFRKLCLLSLGIFLFGCNDFEGNFTVSKHMITRGGYQWILIQKQDSFMCINLPDSLQEDQKTATLRYEFTGVMDTLYQVGPIDLPVFFKSLPQIKIIEFIK